MAVSNLRPVHCWRGSQTVKREMLVEVMAHGLSQHRVCGLIEITQRSFRLRQRGIAGKSCASGCERWPISGGAGVVRSSIIRIRREAWRVNLKR